MAEKTSLIDLRDLHKTNFTRFEKKNFTFRSNYFLSPSKKKFGSLNKKCEKVKKQKKKNRKGRSKKEIKLKEKFYKKKMNEVIEVVNDLHEALGELKMDLKLDLPQIAVVGSQSSGKSSVLENIVGKDFLPRGSGIVTRCPLVLQLIQRPAKSMEEWAEFAHKPGTKFTDFSDVRREIERYTTEVAGPQGITNKPIQLKVYSPKVLTLTLVDLPGLVMNAVGDQPKDIDRQIKDMVVNFVKPSNTIILAITPANADIATSASLRLAKQLDPDGLRTIGVLTKLDLMDRGTDAMDVLNGKLVQLRSGFIGVVNRSQQDINENKAMGDAREAERQYFQSHHSYSSIADRLGTEYLAKVLNHMLVTHIQNKLPELKANVDKLHSAMRKQQEALGMLENQRIDPGAQLLQLIKTFSDGINRLIDGDATESTKNELVGGARLDYIFHECFTPYITSLRASKDLTDDYIRTTIRNRAGMNSTIFPSDQVFITLSKQQVRRLEEPSVKCVNFVHEELLRIVELASQKLDRFPQLKTKVITVSQELLLSYRTPTTQHVRTSIAAEESYVNVKNPRMQEVVSRVFEKQAQAIALAQHAQQVALQPPTPVAPPTPTPAAKGGQPQHSQPGQAPPPTPAAVIVALPIAVPILRNQSMTDVPRNIHLGSGMSEAEQRQNNQIRDMVEGYFLITEVTVADQVPKIINLLMIMKLREEIYPKLVSELYRTELIEHLLAESADVATKRKATVAMMKCLSAAQNALNKARDYR